MSKGVLLYFSMIVCLSVANCRAQNVVCCNSDNRQEIVLQYYDGSALGLMQKVKFLKKGELALKFNRGFSDSLCVYVDNKIVLRDYFQTKEEEETTGKFFVIRYSTEPGTHILKISDVLGLNCVELPIDDRYCVLRIDRNPFKKEPPDQRWWFSYLNYDDLYDQNVYRYTD